jgi:hypothetical protein
MSDPENTTVQLFDIVREALVENELHFDEEPEEGTINFDTKSDNAAFHIGIRIDQEKALVAVFTTTPITIPASSQVAVTILLNLLNQEQIVSTFYLDTDDGAVVLRACIDVEDGSLSHTMVNGMVHGSVHVYDTAFPKIMAVAFARMTPHEAMKLGEKKSTAGEE